VAKKPYRHTISWQQLHNRGLVYGRAVEIKEQLYLVRLMNGGDLSDPTIVNEWCTLFCQIHQLKQTDSYYNQVKDHTVQPWVNYTDEDLLMYHIYGSGTYCWTSDSCTPAGDYRVYRGDNGVYSAGVHDKRTAHLCFGWRPVLVPIT